MNLTNECIMDNAGCSKGQLQKKIYNHRFSGEVDNRKNMWKILCRCFFQQYISEGSCLVELGAGYCEFINEINAGRKIAVDINPNTGHMANDDVEVINTSCTDISQITDSSVDIVFTSNFFEHIPHSDIIAVIKETARILKVGGKFLVLQPSIRFCGKDYWMFFDHITAVDDRALVEILESYGFIVNKWIPKFLPFTTKSRLPVNGFFIKLYLKIPFLWKLFGSQSFVCVEKA